VTHMRQRNFLTIQKVLLLYVMLLKSALKCPICDGYLDPIRSVSYDHIIRVQDGGIGSSGNCDLTHPYCNQSVKN
jgi:hypothetical protein